MRLFSNKRRPVHLSPFPMEHVARAPLSDAALAAVKTLPPLPAAKPGNLLDDICGQYCSIYEGFRNGAISAEKAPYFESPAERANELKSMALFFDATLVGASAIPPAAWKTKPITGHAHAIVLLVEYGDHVEAGNPVHDLIAGSEGAAARMRASEVAVVLSAYIRQLGFNAVAHTPRQSDVSLPVMVVQAGLARHVGGGGAGERLEAPFIGTRFAIAAVTTDMALEPDLPLAPRRPFEGGVAWWLGTGGTETWWNRRQRRRRPGEWGRYPMEKVKRVDETTTLIIDDEVPRLPKRSNGFYRGHKGDFGDKVAREFSRFAIKTPVGLALADLQIAHTPHQDGQVAPKTQANSHDPEDNRRALKTLAHHLGADIAGTCEAKRYTWYSHD
ncbi:MAG: hypothetical protein ACREIP_13515, partial [Alphaproteobacteria bacterium]